jgi:pyruvate/2-oxoglutarate dehydrogenase complex dihydrolipoamide dehydrogenase (E3) component
VHDWSVDFASVMERKERVVLAGRAGYLEMMAADPGWRLIRAHGAFESPTRIGWEGGEIEAPKTIIAVGAETVWPPVPGLRGPRAFDSTAMLRLPELPHRLAVIGGGPIGSEFAHVFARLGSDVTMVIRRPRLLIEEDPEAVALVEASLQRDGVRILRESVVREVTRDNRGVHLRIGSADEAADGAEELLEVDAVHVAAGRRALVERIGLHRAGIRTSAGGGVEVDDELRTAAPNVWAIGDALGRRLYTHVATYEGPIAARNAVGAEGLRPRYDAVPGAIFTDPELASVGLTADEARRQGFDVVVSTSPFRRVGKARAIGEEEGFTRLVADRASGRILGAVIVGYHAADLLPEVLTSMAADGTIAAIRGALHTHPTLSEGVNAAARQLESELAG